MDPLALSLSRRLRRGRWLLGIAALGWLLLAILLVVDAAAGERTGQPKVEVAETPIQAMATILIAFTAPGAPNDWITIVRPGARQDEYGRWTMLEGKTEGTVSFEGLPPGQYEVRLFGGERVTLLARAPLVVEGKWKEPAEAPSVRTEKPFYSAKEQIVAHYQGAWMKEETDYLVLSESSRHDSYWSRLAKALHAPEGSVTFVGQPPGSYELRLYRARSWGGSDTVIARYRFGVGDDLAEKFPELAGSALAEAVGWEARCRVLRGWLGAWRSAYPLPQRRPRRPDEAFWQLLAKPYLDPAFIPVFGSPIEEIRPETRKYFAMELFSMCKGLLSETFVNAATAALLGRFPVYYDIDLTFERAVEAARRQREIAVRLGEAEAALDALVIDAGAYQQVLDLEKRYEADLGWATADEVARYLSHLKARRTLAADAALERRGHNAIASAKGLSGASALAAFEREEAQIFGHASEATGAGVRAAVAEAIADQLRPSVEPLAARLAAIGSGGAGLRTLAELHGEIVEELGAFVEHPLVRELMDAYVEREREIVPGAVPDLLVEVAALPTIEAANAFRNDSLGRAEAWELVSDTTLPAALRRREVELWRTLEGSAEPFWPLPERGPGEDELLAALSQSDAPQVRPPMGHEIMLAMTQPTASASAQTR
jgi:hypothetical protein